MTASSAGTLHRESAEQRALTRAEPARSRGFATEGRALRRTVALHVVVVLAYLAVSFALWSSVWVTGHPTQSIGCVCGDPAEELWWLRWLPWAFAHGHNPFFSTLIYTGNGGVNLLANTSIEAAALVLSPVTALFGPVAALNVGVLLAPVLSAWCFFLFARKVSRTVAGPLLGGALWGFSPFVVDNLQLYHLPHVLGFFPPLAGILVHDALVGHRRSARTNGLLLALLMVAQFFTSTEMLAMFTLVGAVGLVAALALAHRMVRMQWRSLLSMGATAAVVAGAVLAYPTWFALAGPRHISGPPWPTLYQPSAPADIVSAGPVHAREPIATLVGYFGLRGPGPGYLGWSLLAFLGVSAVVWWRRRLAWSAIVTGLVAWSLSWGVRGSLAWSPGRVVAKVPVISNIEPQRYADMVALCAAVLLVLSFDGWVAWSVRWLRSTDEGRAVAGSSFGWASRRTAASAVLALVGLIVLLPIAGTYSWPVVKARLQVPEPTWFRTSATRLPLGTKVLVIPYSPFSGASAMGYQAVDGMQFSIAGGYQVVPGIGTASILVKAPPADEILDALSFPSSFNPEPVLDPGNLSAVRAALAAWHMQRVVVVDSANSSDAVSFMSRVIGSPPERVDGGWQWMLGPAAARR